MFDKFLFRLVFLCFLFFHFLKIYLRHDARRIIFKSYLFHVQRFVCFSRYFVVIGSFPFFLFLLFGVRLSDYEKTKTSLIKKQKKEIYINF